MSLSRSYQAQYDRINKSRGSVNTSKMSHSQQDSSRNNSEHRINHSNLTEVERLSTPSQFYKRHYPNSFSDLSTSTNVLYSDTDKPKETNRYQRLLTSLNKSTSRENESPAEQNSRLKPVKTVQFEPSISNYDPMDINKTECPENKQTNRPHAKGILSSRVVNGSEWKSLSHVRNRKKHRPRSTSFGKAGASYALKASKISLSSCFRKMAANNNALDAAGKLNLVSCYMNYIDQLPSTLSHRVRTLYLSNNSLSTLQGIQQFSNLCILSVTNNMLRYLDALVPLSSLVHLERLSLEGNVVTSMPFYREIVLGLCSSPMMNSERTLTSSSRLQVLDGVRITTAEWSNSRIIFRKVCGQLDLMRCNELRRSVLDHACRLSVCHSQLISEVVRKFQCLLGAHVNTNEDCSRVQYVGNLLRIALAGGVFRWLQIGCGSMYARRSQEIALKMFYTATRSMSATARQDLLSSPSQLYTLWNQILSESLQHQQQDCAQLAHEFEKARDKVETAYQLRRSDEMRISGERHFLRGSRPPPDSMEGFPAEAWRVLQQLDFVDTTLFGFTEDMQSATKNSDNLDSNASARNAWEVQVTYCGIGPHYTFPVSDLLNDNNVKLQQQYLENHRNLSLKQLQEDHKRKIAREENIANANKNLEAGDVQERYAQLLRQNLKKPVKSKVNVDISPNEEEGSGLSSPSGFLSGPKKKQVESTMQHSNEVMESESLGLNAQEYFGHIELDADSGSESPSEVSSRTRTRTMSAVTDPSLSPRGEEHRKEVEEKSDDSSTSSSESSSASSTDSYMSSCASATSAISAKSIKSAKSLHSSHSVKSAKSLISMKSVTKDGETKVLKLTPENLKMQHENMKNLTKRNLEMRRPNFSNVFKELGETVSSAANLEAVGGSVNEYSIHDFLEETRSYCRHTESEVGSEHGSMLSMDEMYTSPGAFLSKDHLEQERLLIKLLESRKVKEFCSEGILEVPDANTLPNWCEELFTIPQDMVTTSGDSKSVLNNDFDVESISKDQLMELLLGKGGLGPAPVPWCAANTTAAAAPSMRQLTRLFEGASEDYSTIQATLKKVVKARSLLQKQMSCLKSKLSNDGIAASKELEKLAKKVRKTSKLNRKAQERWLVAANALDDLLDIRQNILSQHAVDLEFEENALKTVEEEVLSHTNHKQSLLESKADVDQAMQAMTEEMKESEAIKDALKDFQSHQLAVSFFMEPGRLVYSRRKAFEAFRRRVRRQIRIREFHREVLCRQCIELMFTSFSKIKKFNLKQRRHHLAWRWIQKRKQEVALKAWKRVYGYQLGSMHLAKKRDRYALQSFFWKWQVERRRSLIVGSEKEKQSKRLALFHRKWIFVKWKNLTRRNRIRGSETDVSRLSRSIFRQAAAFHKRYIFQSWRACFVRTKSDLADRCLVVTSLSNEICFRNTLSYWYFSYLSCRNRRLRAFSRVLKRLRCICHWHSRCRSNRKVAVVYGQRRAMKMAILSLDNNSRRRKDIRSKALQVIEKRKLKLLIWSYSLWRVSKIEMVHMQLQSMKAMSLYITHITRKAWKCLVLFYWQSKADRQKRQLQHLQNLRYRSSAFSHKFSDVLKCPVGFKSHDSPSSVQHVEGFGMTIDMISSDEEEDIDNSTTDSGSVNTANQGMLYTKLGFYEATTYATFEAEDCKKDMSITRLRLKRLKDKTALSPLNSNCYDTNNPQSTVKRASTKSAFCAQHPLVCRLRCRQYWKRWFLRSKRNAKSRSSYRRLRRNSTIRTARRCFSFLFHKWTKRCFKRMLAAHDLEGTDAQFINTINDYKAEISSRNSELSAARIELDEVQAQLAESQLKFEENRGKLSTLSKQKESFQIEHDEAVSRLGNIQEQIRAVLIFCGQEESKDATSRDSTVFTEDFARLKRSRQDDGSNGEIFDAVQSLNEIRAQINKFTQVKHQIEEEIEHQHKQTHDVQNEFAKEKHMLELSRSEASKVCSQYSGLLHELDRKNQEYLGQRGEAEQVLKECSLALEIASDTVRRKQSQLSQHLDDLNAQHESLLFAQQSAEEEEAKLRKELDALRREGDGQDRSRMEVSPLKSIANSELAASDYRASALSQRDIAEKELYKQQQSSACALADVVLEERECIADLEHQDKRVHKERLSRLHSLRKLENEGAHDIMSSSSENCLEGMGISDRIGKLSSRIRKRLTEEA